MDALRKARLDGQLDLKAIGQFEWASEDSPEIILEFIADPSLPTEFVDFVCSKIDVGKDLVSWTHLINNELTGGDRDRHVAALNILGSIIEPILVENLQQHELQENSVWAEMRKSLYRLAFDSKDLSVSLRIVGIFGKITLFEGLIDTMEEQTNLLLRTESRPALDQLLLLAQRQNAGESLQPALLLALVNVFGVIGRRRPSVFLPVLLPVLISLYEGSLVSPHPKRARSTSTTMTVSVGINLEHALKMQISGFLDIPDAEAYAPLIMECLDRIGSDAGASKRKSSSAVVEVEEPMEELEVDDKLGKRQTAAYAPDASAASNVSTSIISVATLLPLPLVVDVLLRVLPTIYTDTLPAAVETWRPTLFKAINRPKNETAPALNTTTVSALKASEPNKRHDPRLRSKEEMTEETEAKPKQPVGPFRLVSESMDDQHIVSHASFIFQRVLEAGTPIAARFGRRREWARLVTRLALLTCLEGGETTGEQQPSSIDQDIYYLDDQLIGFVFEDLSMRVGLLLQWLRLVWLQRPSQYALWLGRILERFSSLIEEELGEKSSNSGAPKIANWEMPLVQILAECPQFEVELVAHFFESLLISENMAQSSEEDTEGEGFINQEDHQQKRQIAFRLLQRLLEDRIGCRVRLTKRLFVGGLWCHPDVRIRRAALDPDLLASIPTSLIESAALNALQTDHEDEVDIGTVLDLPLRLVQMKPSFLQSLARNYVSIPAAMQDYVYAELAGQIIPSIQSIDELLKALSSILSSMEENSAESEAMDRLLLGTVKESFKHILNNSGDDEHQQYHHLEHLGKLVREAIQSRGAVYVGPLFSAAAIAAISSSAQARKVGAILGDETAIWDLTAKLASLVDSRRELVLEGMRNLLVSRAVSPGDLFVRLHRYDHSKLPLKAAMEALQICFTDLGPAFFPAKTLAAALHQLVDLPPPLPTLLMRSVIQTATLHRGSLGAFVTGLLGRLIGKRVWEQPRAWEGFIRCLRVIGPQAAGQVLVQLPADRLERLLSGGKGAQKEQHFPDLREHVRDYLNQQPPSVRMRFSAILAAIGNSKEEKS